VSKLFDEAKRARQQRPSGPVQLPDFPDLDVEGILENIEDPNDVHAKEAFQAPTAPAIPAVPVVEEPAKVSIVDRNSRVALVGGGSSAKAVESYRTLRTRLINRQAKKKISTIMITSAIPGEGKTLTALNLALCYAQLPEARVLLVDADLRSRGLSAHFGNPEIPGLLEVLAGEVSSEEAILTTDHKNLFFVNAGAKMGTVSPAEQFASPNWKEFLAKNSELYSVILVDSPPVLAVSDSELIGAGCDGLLVVVRALHTSREVLQRMTNSIDKSKFLGIVYNAVPESAASVDHYGNSYRYVENSR
jgi:capsular exopolysaccharide synthesis family protein